MKKYIVIFFVFMSAQLSWAQTSAPSKEWLSQVQEVVTTSNAWAAVNAVVPNGISKEMLNDLMWKDVLFGYPTHVQLVSLRGDFTLIDGKNTLILKDTVLQVWVTDISVPFYIPDGVDVTGTEFLVPIYDGQSRIIKSYAPSGQGQDALADTKKSLSESSTFVAKVANVEWVEEGESFFHDGFFYQKNAEGKWESEDPNAPQVLKVGDRKKDPSFVFTKNASGEWVPSASNKRNAYKFGMGDHAGYRNNYYRNAFNGSPLGGGYGGGAYPVSGGYYQPQPYYGSPLGGGYGGGGFSWGFSFGFGFGGGYNNGFGCVPPPCVPANRWATGGPAVWNGYELVPISFGSGYYNDPYWKSSGRNGNISSEMLAEKQLTVSSSVGNTKELGFVDIAPPVTARVVTKESPRDFPVTTAKEVSIVDQPANRNLGSSHGENVGRASNSAATTKPREIVLGPSHGGVKPSRDVVIAIKEPMAPRGGNVASSNSASGRAVNHSPSTTFDPFASGRTSASASGVSPRNTAPSREMGRMANQNQARFETGSSQQPRGNTSTKPSRNSIGVNGAAQDQQRQARAYNNPPQQRASKAPAPSAAPRQAPATRTAGGGHHQNVARPAPSTRSALQGRPAANQATGKRR